jgi:sugar lactone lactonase YvrE
MRKRFLIAGLALAASIAAATQFSATAATTPTPPKVVVNHLNNPRGLVLRGRSLYIAEAGKGGSKYCFNDPEAGGQECIGFTASITKYRRGHKRRIATKLVSFAGADGSFATGADDVTFDPRGRLYTIIAGNNFDLPPGVTVPKAALRQAGNILRLRSHNRRRVFARIDSFEFAHDPDKQGKDSNPYSLVATRSGRIYATDAGGNTLLKATRRGVSLAVIFPNGKRGKQTWQSVPTHVRRGPDGALYVSELGGGSGPAHRAQVWRVVPGKSAKVYAKGFEGLTGLAFGPDGSLYVSEFQTDQTGESPAGDVIRVKPNGKRVTIGTGFLNFPAGIAVSRSGNVYVSNWSTLPASTPPGPPFGGANGQVVRFTKAQAGG